MTHRNEPLQDVWTKGYAVGHTVTHYSVHDEVSSMLFLFFVCRCAPGGGGGGDVPRAKGGYEGTGR